MKTTESGVGYIVFVVAELNTGIHDEFHPLGGVEKFVHNGTN